MKKNRPGTLLRVICAAGETAKLWPPLVFAETTTLGLRIYDAQSAACKPGR